MSASEEEEEETTTHGRPNLYWQQRREAEAAATMTAAFRGVPAPKRGAQVVKEEDTLGRAGRCWCDLPLGHDWPGKAAGAKHPRKEPKVITTEAPPRIDRRQLRGFHRTIQEVILQAVNVNHVKYRLTANNILMYSPDGESTLRLNMRNTDRQLDQARKWFLKNVAHIGDDGKSANPLVKDGDVMIESVVRKGMDAILHGTDGYVDDTTLAKEDEIAKLAAALNDPVEHPRKEEWRPYGGRGQNAEHFEQFGEVVRCKLCDWTTTDKRSVSGHYNTNHDREKMRQALWDNEEAMYRAVETKGWKHRHPGETDETPAPEVPEAGEWRPHYKQDGSPTIFETNGGAYRCTQCGWSTENRAALGGHTRMNHTDTEDLHGKAARAKATESREHNAFRAKVEELARQIAEVTGISVGVADEAYVDDLEAEVERLEQRVKAAEERAAEATKRAEEVEAKLALIREGLSL